MAEGFEAFHVPQQSRRDKLRVLAQSHPSCEAAAAALQGCPGLLPLYDPSLLSSEMLSCSNVGAQEYHHQKNPLSETGEVCKQNPLSVIKEGVNLMGYVSGFVNPSTSSSSSHPTYLDPQSSLALNPGSIQDINGNPFFYTAHNLRDLDNSFNGGEMVAFKPESLLLSLSSNPTVQNNPSLELNYLVRGVPGGGGSTSGDVSRSPLGPFTGYTSVLKGSRFLKPAQQVLEEFCYVGRGIYGEKSCGESSLMDPSMESLSGAAIGEDPLTCGDGSEHRRKKTVLLSMLDEVYRRYKLYYQQLQAVVASFESVAGLCNAAPYTSFALKIMLKHFNCLKNGIIGQLRFTGKTLGEGSYEKDGNPRLGTTERVLQTQKPGHNLGILEHQHVWRPQRGLPEHAVAVLRAWLFEHFLHPYPTDTDKQMLAKQTGLSRGQVSNWFINARVRLWKPMVEEIHTLETQQTLKASEAEERTLDKPVHHPASPYSLSDKQPQTTPTQMPQDPPSKRSRNILPTVPDKNDEPKNFSYHNLSSQHHVSVGGIGVSATGGNSGVSLTLGLPQNNGIGLSEPLPMNLSHHFGLDASSEGYVIGGFETPNQHFGKDIGGQLLHDFVG